MRWSAFIVVALLGARNNAQDHAKLLGTWYGPVDQVRATPPDTFEMTLRGNHRATLTIISVRATLDSFVISRASISARWNIHDGLLCVGTNPQRPSCGPWEMSRDSNRLMYKYTWFDRRR